MAGDRHHYIPQFLQRGFSSHSSGKQFFTWVYRKESKPYNPNIINSGVKQSFMQMITIRNSIMKSQRLKVSLVN